MTMKVRALFVFLLALATMLTVNCSPYSCQAEFGASTCTPSGGGLGGGGGNGGGGGGGGGTGTPTAFAFAVDEAGTIDGYTLNATAGTFGQTVGYVAPVIPSNDGGVGMVVAQSQFLYAGFGNGTLYGWTISASGNLTNIAGSPFTATFLQDFVPPVGQAAIITNPSGTLLFMSDSIGEKIDVYSIGSGGVVSPVTGSPFTVPFEPMNLATDGQGKYLYAINGNPTTHTGSEIAAYTISSATGSVGALTPVPGTPFVYPMWLLKPEPTGNYMVGTTGNNVTLSGNDDDNLYVFSITQTGANAGALTQIGKTATTYSPFSIAAQSNSGGNLIYSFSFNDTATGFYPVEGFQISSTGALTELSTSPFSNVAEGTWGQFDQLGTYLFVWGSYLDQSTNTQLTQLGPDQVGSGGVLTQPLPTLTLASESFWTVTDPQ